MNRKTFSSYLTKAKSFSLYIYGVSVVSGWRYIITVPPVAMAISALKMTLKITRTVTIPKVTLTLNTFKEVMNFTNTLDVRTITLSQVISQLLSIGSTLTLPATATTMLMTLLQKFDSLTLTVPKVALASSPTVAHFLPLSTHDPILLSVLDAETLVDLDYTVI